MHFEILADDPERASAFYTDVFGWTIESWPGLGWEYRVIMTQPKDAPALGINGGMMQRKEKAPERGMTGVNAFICTVVVDDFEACSAKILAAGGAVAKPKFALPGMAWQGYFFDTEGNTFGIHQEDKEAA